MVAPLPLLGRNATTWPAAPVPYAEGGRLPAPVLNGRDVMSELYLNADPRPELTILEVDAVPTAVVQVTDYPMADMGALFDRVFGSIFAAMAQGGVKAAGAAFALHRRMPTETSDFEVGLPIDQRLDRPHLTDGVVEFVGSEIPAGRVATRTYVGSYDGLGEAWRDFMGAVAAAGEQAEYPFWEVYVTPPTPTTDPATLRTDLYTRIS